MKHPKDKRHLEMSEIMTPEKVNFSGNIHGGYILKLIDQAAYACAARYSGSYVVTLSIDQMFFKEPVYVGELVTLRATINYVGRTSMEVEVRVRSENLITGEKRQTNSCYATMVAVDKSLKPVAVKPLTIHTEDEQRRYEEAQIRKEMRNGCEKRIRAKRNLEKMGEFARPNTSTNYI